MSGESDTLRHARRIPPGFIAAGFKTQPELGRQSGSHPRFGVPIARDRWIGRWIKASMVNTVGVAGVSLIRLVNTACVTGIPSVPAG